MYIDLYIAVINPQASSGFNSISSSSIRDRNLRSDVRQMRIEISELSQDVTQLRGQMLQLAADMQKVVDNTFRIMHAVGTSTGRPSIDSTLSNVNFTGGSSGHSSSLSANGTAAQTECPSRKGSAQSEDDFSKQMQEPMWQPPVSKYQRMDTTLQIVPEETASMTSPTDVRVHVCTRAFAK